MTKVTIPIGDVLVLDRELNSLLTEEQVSFVTKYDITKLLEKVSKVSKRFSDSRVEIIKKYGSEVEDKRETYTLENAKKEDREKAFDELEKLAEKKEVFEGHSFTAEDFKDMKSKYPYKIFYSFVKK